MNTQQPIKVSSIHPLFQTLFARRFARVALPLLIALCWLAPRLLAAPLYLDFTTNGGVSTTGWTAVNIGTGQVNLPNVGGSGYGFSFINVFAYQGGAALPPLTRAGFHTSGAAAALPRVFTVTGLPPNKSVKLHACAAWDAGRGAYIVYGDTGASGVKATTLGTPGTTATLENLSLIGTAIADETGTVSGSIHGRDGVGTAAEGQIGGFVFLPTQVITASAGANGTISPLGAVDVTAGSSPTYTITAAPGYHVADVLVDGESVGALTSYTFTNVVADRTISASFAVDSVAYTITSVAGANGTISPSGAVQVFQGVNQPFTIVPEEGYHIVDVVVDGNSIGPVASHTFLQVSANHSIRASFGVNTHSITASAGANGSISPAGETIVNYGDSQSFTITPASGYYVSAVLVDGVSVGAPEDYLFNFVTGDHTITATFDNRTRLNLDFTQTGGSYTPGWIPIHAGITTDTMVNVADVGGLGFGFTFDHVGVWDNNNGAQSLTRSGFYNFGGIVNPHPFKLTGLIPGQAVTLYACAGWDGNANGAYVVYGDSGAAGKKAQTVGYPGTTPTIANLTLIGTATVDVTGAVSGAMHGGAGVGSALQGQLGGFVFAIEAPPVRTITAIAGANGTISPSGGVSVTSGANQTFQFAANNGYHLADVLVDGVSVGAVESYTFTTVTADHTISASFAVDTVSYTVTATAGANGTISPSGALVLNHGVNQVFAITADPGHHVVDVLVDGVSIGPVTSYGLTSLAANHTISASFAINTYAIEASAEGHGSITPAGSTIVNHGGSQSYTITPEEDYLIDEVVVDGVAMGAIASYTFSDVTANHTIAASFDNRIKVKLDFTQTGGSFTANWTPVYGNWLADTLSATATNIGGLGFDFAVEHVGSYDNGQAWESLTRSGFYTMGNNTNPHGFSLKGLPVGRMVKLYACAGWDGNARCATIVFGDSGTNGVLAQTIGSPGTSPTLANLTLIGTAMADAAGAVAGSLHGHDGVETNTEGQVGGLIFVIEPAGGAPTDADGDGMTDAWELTHFGSTDEGAAGDFDGDGTSNLTEFRLGLIPNSGVSRFAATRSAAGKIEWPSAVGITFKIERSPSLAVDSWTVLEAALAGTAGTATFTDPAPLAGSGFYRITLNP